MNPITRLATFVAASTFLCQQAFSAPTLGGNLPPLRPSYTTLDEQQFDLALSYLRPGDVARIPALEWEVAWSPSMAYNYRGIDRAVQKLAIKGIVPMWILQPCPAPNSPWYSNIWPDWWMPSRDLWQPIVRMNTTIATHIATETRKYNTFTPLFQLWNEPAGGKPGGSIMSKYGEWSPGIHELLYLLVTDLRLNQILKSQIVTPAISAFGENRRSETSEYLSMMPPKTFDWLSECGLRDCHLRLSAPAAHGDINLVRTGFQASLDWYKWVDARFTWPVGQIPIVSELYVTPGDCDVPIGTPLYQYHAAALDLMKASSFRYVSLWGLRPVETDVPGNPYETYGGFGDSLVRWRTGKPAG